MDWGQSVTQPFRDLDVLARLREITALPAGGSLDAALRDSEALDEERAVEEGILAEAIFQSEKEALAAAGLTSSQPHSIKCQVYAVGYTRAGESEVVGYEDEHEREARDASAAAATTRRSSGWKAAVPLFCFMVVQTDSCGEESGRHCITKSREDFEALHASLAQACSAQALPKLPGRKLLNANSHAHLRKRLGRYQAYLSDLACEPDLGRAAALHDFLQRGPRDQTHSRPTTWAPEAAALMQRMSPPPRAPAPAPQQPAQALAPTRRALS